MKKLSPRTTGLLLGLGAVVAAVTVPLAITAALPPGTPAAGSVTLNPPTGTSDTTFNLVFSTPPAPQSCPGDATASYRWSTFITPATNDAGAMIYTPSGTPSGAPSFSNNLADAIGTRIRAVNPGLGDGLVVAPTGLSFASTLFGALPPGDYKVGIACTLPDAQGVVQTVKFWSGVINITAQAGAGTHNFTYGAGPGATTTTTSTTTTSTTTTTTSTTSTTTTSTTTVPPTTTTTTTVAPTTTTPTTTTTTPTATTTTTTTTVPTTTTMPATTTTVLPPTTSTTTPPSTTTTIPTAPTTTTTPPTTTTTTTTPPNPRPPGVFDVTCAGGPLRHSTEGTLRVIRLVWWLPKLAVFTPDGGRPMLGLVKDIDVYVVGDKAISRGNHGSARGFTTCVSDPYQAQGRTLVSKFKIRF